MNTTHDIQEIDQSISKIEEIVDKALRAPLDRRMKDLLMESVGTLQQTEVWLLDKINPQMGSLEAIEIHGFIKRSNELRARIDSHLARYGKIMAGRIILDDGAPVAALL